MIGVRLEQSVRIGNGTSPVGMRAIGKEDALAYEHAIVGARWYREPSHC